MRVLLPPFQIPATTEWPCNLSTLETAYLQFHAAKPVRVTDGSLHTGQ